MIRSLGLWAVLREDYQRHHRKLHSPGLQTLAVHRIGVFATTRAWPLRALLGAAYRVGWVFCKNVYGIEIERTVEVGRRLQIGHQHGIVIHRHARIGDDCVIRQGVTLGIGSRWTHARGPVIGNRVQMGVNAVLVGNVVIGDDVKIGPNCVVMTNVPAGHTVTAPPPRMMPSLAAWAAPAAAET
jgi:serine O-acetyltransferase